MRPDHLGVVRVSGRKELVEERFLDDSVGLILQTLPPLVPHDVLLGREIRLIELVDQISQSIGLGHSAVPSCFGWNGLEIVLNDRNPSCQAKRSGAAPAPFEVAKMLAGFHVFGSLKSRARIAGRSRLGRVSSRDRRGTPDIDGLSWEPVILGEVLFFEPISELVFLERDGVLSDG